MAAVGVVPSPANPATNPINPAANESTYTAGPAPTPAMMALPANTAPLATDTSSTRKFYTLTASLREIYDDNVGTSNVNPQASFETELSPSILVDFPRLDGDFSARYTLNLTYYSVGPNNTVNTGNSKNSSAVEYTHEFVAQYSHAFSDRFNIALAEQFRYYTEPSLYESVGTNYQNGAYISNAVNGTFSAQWTPLFSTSTTYANTIIKYDDAAVAINQDDVENTGSQVFSFAVLPKVSVSVGANVDNISYDSDLRGYTDYTGFFGAQWQVLPSLSVTGRGGYSYTEMVQGEPLTSPYAALSVDWSLGARSHLSFSYSHEIVPTDQIAADGEVADRFASNFRYDITSNLSSHLQGILTDADITQSLINSGSGISSYTEIDYALDAGLTYHYNSYLDFDCGIILSGVSSEIDVRSYSRDEAYIGVRGTY